MSGFGCIDRAEDGDPEDNTERNERPLQRLATDSQIRDQAPVPLQDQCSRLFRLREPGDEKSPQLVELRYEPGSEIRLHSHDEDEIIYVLSGEMRIGNRKLSPGSTLTVPGGVFYGFHAGPEGLVIPNFRPRTDSSGLNLSLSPHHSRPAFVAGVSLRPAGDKQRPRPRARVAHAPTPARAATPSTGSAEKPTSASSASVASRIA